MMLARDRQRSTSWSRLAKSKWIIEPVGANFLSCDGTGDRGTHGMKSSRIILRLRRNLRDYGWRVTVRKVTSALFRPLYESREYRIYRIDLQRLQLSPPSVGRFTFRFLAPSEIGEIDQIEHMEDWLAGSVRRRLMEGSICLVTLDRQRVAGFNLISFARINVPVIGWTRTFRRGFAWSEQISTAPGYRRQGIASELRYRIFAELKRRGFRRLYGGALASNRPSLNLAARVGFEQIVTVRFRRLLTFRGVRYCRVKHRIAAGGSRLS